MSEAQLIGAAVAGIALLLYLIIRIKLPAFVALLVGCLVIGVGAGLPLDDVLDAIATGVGSTLASIAVVIGLGAVLGRMLEVSGGAQALASALLERFGQRAAPWSLLLVGFVVAIPVFFDVAFIILISLVYGLTSKTGRPIVYYALPLLAGLAVAHAFIPPTPGPIAVAKLLGADLGWVMLLGAVVGLPAAAIAGPVYARFAARHVQVGVPADRQVVSAAEPRDLPSVGLVIVLIGVPLGLIVANTVAGATLAEGDLTRAALAFVGHPMIALLIAVLLSLWLLGGRGGYSRAQLQQIATAALEPAGVIILVTAAGGALKQVLVAAGVGDAFAKGLATTTLSPLLVAFTIAATVRLLQGSATVAMLTAAGLVAALLGGVELTAPVRALLVVAIAAGATIASHVNDSGFWLVNRYLGLTVPQTLGTWTVTGTIIAFVSLLLTLGLGVVLG